VTGDHRVRDQAQARVQIPASWRDLAVHYRHRETIYHLRVVNRGGALRRVVCDGVEQDNRRIPLRDDRREHHVEIELAER
jgi:cyclic beta-1,2-glucan synthetase